MRAGPRELGDSSERVGVHAGLHIAFCGNPKGKLMTPSANSSGGVLLALADRVEAAAGPDRELDIAIWLAVEPTADAVWAQGKQPLPWLHCYTSSLDAATSLFPGDTMYRSGHSATGADPSMFFCDAVTDAPLCADVHSLAVTEPLARTAAALRALAQVQQ
jgi:hypothetical protein